MKMRRAMWDISLGSERACDGLKLERQRRGSECQLREQQYIHRTRTRTRTPFSRPHFARVFMVIGMPLHTLLYSILFYSTNNAFALLFRPYLCSDPNLSDHSSSEGGFFLIFGVAASALSTSSAMDVKGVRKP
jgi:hypothetical protein